MSLLPPQPSVTVKPVSRTNPIVEQAIDEIKKKLNEDGFVTVQEYLVIQGHYQLPDEILLPALQQGGMGFVMTETIKDLPRQEVIVDLRYMAAAMLLIYSDDTYGFQNSVLKCLQRIYELASWEAAAAMHFHKGLVEETYGQYGHHFSDGTMADLADLSAESEELIEKQAKRHLSALTNLAKSEAELTQVYHLALDTMRTMNDPRWTRGDLRLVWGRMHQFPKSEAYKHFWRTVANKIMVKNRPRYVANIKRFTK